MSHCTPSPERCSVAPYNFVPLPEKVSKVAADQLPDHDSYQAKTFSGWFDVTLETKTPLYIRCPLTESEAQRKEAAQKQKQKLDFPDFYYTESKNKPVIPGSSLRGMLRNLVEIITQSKMGDVSDVPLVFRSFADKSSLKEHYSKAYGNGENLKGGYLKKKGKQWGIQPAQEIDGKTFVLVNGSDDTEKNEYSRLGYVYAKSGKTPKTGVVRKHAYVCPISPKEGEWIRIPSKVWHAFVNDRDMHRGIGIRKVEKDGDPLFYLLNEEGEVVFLGHTRMMRLPYNKSPFELLPDEHREHDSIDLAEAMFGFCGKNKGKQGEKSVAYRHRISVSDAALVNERMEIWYSPKPVVPKILSSPKPTTFQHYLVQPDDGVRSLHHYDSEGAELRGHKLYWHKSANDFVETDQAKLKKSASQYTKIKPVRKGVHFQFKVHFDNLSEEELVYLCLAMQPCSSNSKEYCHKLGIGKPLGLGTVKLTPEMWIVNRRTRYGTFGEIGARKFPLPQSEENGTFASKPRIRELLAMMHFPGEVPDAHKVYLDQHSVAGGSNIKVFKDRRVLPKPTDVKVSSPK